jgi:flavin-dependent dehydrogenase
MPLPDVVIIGAGPTGTLAAILLARGGAPVTLIEQHQFPRDKVCGECISALGLAVLVRAGLRDLLASDRPATLHRAILYATNGSSASLELSDPMWGLSRSRLDARLLEEAAHSGARVIQPARCEALYPGRTPRVLVRDLQANHQVELHPSVVLLADGKAALLQDRPRATKEFGIKAHFTNVDAPRDAIELFGVHGHYGGLAPIETARWNAAFSVPACDIARCGGDTDAVFQQMQEENIALRQQFECAIRVSPWRVSPLPRFGVSRRWPAGIIPLGNAAAALEPIGGEGIGLALRSAELAAQTLIETPASPADLARLRAQFAALWRIRRPACRLAAKVLSSPPLAKRAVEVLQFSNSLARLALNLMGKSPSSASRGRRLAPG